MEGFEGFDLQVDSAVDLMVSVADESSITAEGVDEQHVVGSIVGSGARSSQRIETRALVVADAGSCLVIEAQLILPGSSCHRSSCCRCRRVTCVRRALQVWALSWISPLRDV